MKLLWALTFSLLATSAMACTNFTGAYRDESSKTYEVSQSGCELVTVYADDAVERIITDGQFRVTSEDDQVRITSAASFVGNNLTITGNIEYKVTIPPEFPADKIPSHIVTIYTLDSAGNLVMNLTVLNSNNQVIAQTTMTHQRI